MAGARALAGAAVAAMPLAIGAAPAQARGYEPTGDAVEGGTAIADAPLLAPGDHLDALDGPGDDAYYRVDGADGRRIWATATLSAPDGLALPSASSYATWGVRVEILDAGGSACTAASDSSIGETSNAELPLLAWAVTDPLGTDDACASGPMFVHVERTGELGEDQSTPLELHIASQPPLEAAPGDIPAEILEDEGPAPADPPSPEPVALGTSYGAAVPLAPGSHVVELDARTARYATVDVAEGQRLRWRLEVTEGDADSSTGRQVSVRQRNALRMPVALADGGVYDISATRGGIGGGGTAAPLRARHIGAEDSSIVSTWLSGTQYLQLALGPGYAEDPSAPDDTPVRAILTIEVDGQAEPTPQTAGADTGDSPFAALPWYRITTGAGALAALGLGLGLLTARFLLRRRRA